MKIPIVAAGALFAFAASCLAEDATVVLRTQAPPGLEVEQLVLTLQQRGHEPQRVVSGQRTTLPAGTYSIVLAQLNLKIGEGEAKRTGP